MLKVSHKTEYAMRAVVELAIRRAREGDALVPARAIAEAQHIPLRFLEQQLGALHKAGLVESFRGAGGGCRLARDPAEIRVADVVDAIEGTLFPMFCLDVENHACFADAHCGLQGLWGDVHVAMMLCSARRSATPIESTRRLSMPGLSTMRSTSTSIV